MKFGVFDHMDRGRSDLGRQFDERLRLIEGIEAVIDGVYTHLPLKRARYGTDPVQRLHLIALFKKLGAEGRTVIVSSHVLNEVERLADAGALETAIAPYQKRKGFSWRRSEPSLEDVFIDLMSRSRDNFQ